MLWWEGYYYADFPPTLTSKLPLIAFVSVLFNSIYFGCFPLIFNSITVFTLPFEPPDLLCRAPFDLSRPWTLVLVSFPLPISPVLSPFSKTHYWVFGTGFFHQYPVHISTHQISMSPILFPLCVQPPYIILAPPPSFFPPNSLNPQSHNPIFQVPKWETFSPNSASP